MRVDSAQAGTRLDRYLAPLVGSRAHAQRLIETGAVLVDGRRRPKNHTLSAGETVTAELPSEEPGLGGVGAGAGLTGGVGPGRGSGELAPHGVLYEDRWLLVVDKPAGVVVHPGRGHPTGTLAQALAGRAAGGEDAQRAGIVHRLDRDTSGLLVVAKDEESHRHLKASLAARRMRREYLALVEGRPDARSGTVDAPIGRQAGHRLLMGIGGVAAREARTHFEIERVLPRTTLLRVHLETGRTHQIRVHMAAIGLPVCGDPQYGSVGALGLGRQFLHATRLAFPHPISGEAIDVVSPLPDDLAAALALAERGDRHLP